jgi:hypothetical protein
MKKFHFTIGELQIDRSELELLMGFEPGDLPEPFGAYLSEALMAAPGLCEVEAGYRRVSGPVFTKESYAVQVGDAMFSPGKIVYNQLKKSQEIAVFVATAGQGISRRIKELAEEGDPMQSYVLDMVGSMVAEKSGERLLDILEQELKSENLSLSDPYSPGYCDWSVAEQHQLFSLFPSGFCGVTLSSSSLMSPIKSVSGIAGIGPAMKRKGSQCLMCDLDNCMYGKIITNRKVREKAHSQAPDKPC